MCKLKQGEDCHISVNIEVMTPPKSTMYDTYEEQTTRDHVHEMYPLENRAAFIVGTTLYLRP